MRRGGPRAVSAPTAARACRPPRPSRPARSCDATAAITDLDSVLIRSVGALFTEPGRLTVEYLRGDRHRFLPPFRLFLFCNLIYFVAVADFHFTILTTTFRGQIESMFYKDITRRVLVRRYDLAPGASTAGATPGRATSGYQLLWYYATHRVIGEGELWLVLSLLVPFALYAGAAQRVV